MCRTASFTGCPRSFPAAFDLTVTTTMIVHECMYSRDGTNCKQRVQIRKDLVDILLDTFLLLAASPRNFFFIRLLECVRFKNRVFIGAADPNKSAEQKYHDYWWTEQHGGLVYCLTDLIFLASISCELCLNWLYFKAGRKMTDKSSHFGSFHCHPGKKAMIPWWWHYCCSPALSCHKTTRSRCAKHVYGNWSDTCRRTHEFEDWQPHFRNHGHVAKTTLKCLFICYRLVPDWKIQGRLLQHISCFHVSGLS